MLEYAGALSKVIVPEVPGYSVQEAGIFGLEMKKQQLQQMRLAESQIDTMGGIGQWVVIAAVGLGGFLLLQKYAPRRREEKKGK